MKITVNTEISAPLDKVYAAFTDLSVAEKHIDGIEKIEILHGSKSLSKDTKWKETRKIFGQETTETMWVTEKNKDKDYSVKAESHGTEYTSTYRFKPSENKTSVEFTFSAKPITIAAKVMNLAGFIFRSSTKKMLKKDIDDLKKYLEN